MVGGLWKNPLAEAVTLESSEDLTVNHSSCTFN